MQLEVFFAEIRNIREIQIVQTDPCQVIVRVCPAPAYGSRDENGIRLAVSRWISPKLDVEIEVVSAIERDAGGKFRPVLSRLSEGRVSSAPIDTSAGH